MTGAFDELAPTYDDTFTHTVIGRTMRAAVWRRLGVLFSPGQRVLELNCGTGVDAAWLGERGVEVLATDVSEGMVAAARARGVAAEQCAAEAVGSLAGTFDGAFSNFGGLNCVAELHLVAEGLAQRVRPGGAVLLCVMGPAVPWEWVWYLGHRQPATAFRRFRRSTEWRGLTIRYPSLGAITRVFGPWFTVDRTWALGTFVPPSYAEGWAARHTGAVARLDRLERRTERWWPVVRLADHYVVELHRR